MKKIMVVAALMMSTVMFAQHRSHDGKRGMERGSERMKKTLLLTDDQYSKVKTINENFAKQFKAIRDDKAMTQGAAQEQTKKLREDYNTQLKSVLNEPQWAKWNDMKDKRKGDGKHHQRHRRGHEHGSHRG